MLNANYKVVGIGRIQVPGSPYGTYWTNDFGGYLAPGTPSPIPSAAPTPAPTPPPTPAPTSDADADGFTFATETHLGTNPTDPCGNPNSGLPGSPSDAWPADLNAASTNRVDVMDVATFVAPVRRFDTSPGDPGYNRRWDLVPGRGVLAKDINASDVNAVVAAAPAMFGFERAFNGPSCTP
jgi:hypothetical protein